MPSPTTVLLLAAGLALGLAWLLLRAQASQQGHRRLAVGLVVGSQLLPTLLLALGVLDPRSATGLGLFVLGAGVVEAAFVPKSGLQRYPVWPRRAWAALWLAVVSIQLLALLVGSWPYLPQLSLFAGLGVLWWVRIDRNLVERGITPVWTTFAGLMLLLLPFGLMEGTGSGGSGEALDVDSPYWNPALSAMGLDARWSGMFAHPNALGAFSAMGIGLALAGTRLSWPLLGLSTPLLLASSSRTAGLAALLGTVAYVVLQGKLRLRLGVVVAAGLVGWVTIQSLATDSNAATGTGRYEVWASVPRLLGSDWLWGLGGPGAGADLVESGLLPPWAARLHSIVFEHLLYSGVLGLLFVLILMLSLLLSVRGERGGIPLFLVVLTLALGDNYAHLFELTMGVVGYVAVIAVCTPEPINGAQGSQGGRVGAEWGFGSQMNGDSSAAEVA